MDGVVCNCCKRYRDWEDIAQSVTVVDSNRSVRRCIACVQIYGWWVSVPDDKPATSSWKEEGF